MFFCLFRVKAEHKYLENEDDQTNLNTKLYINQLFKDFYF